MRHREIELRLEGKAHSTLTTVRRLTPCLGLPGRGANPTRSIPGSKEGQVAPDSLLG